MSADPNDVTMVRGDTYALVYNLTNKKTKAPLPLPNGTTAKMTVTSIANPPDDTTKVFEVAGVLTDPGVASFTPTAVQTAAIGKLFYDIQLNGTDASIRTVVKAAFNIVQDRTK